MRLLLVQGLTILGLGLGVAAQTAPTPATAPKTTPAARPGDVSSPEAVMAALYDVLSGPAGKRDWDRFRSLFLPTAHIQAYSAARAGRPARFVNLTIEDYIKQDDPYFTQNAFYEREIGSSEQRYASIAQVFSTFALLHDPKGAPFQRGIESCQIIFDGTRWWMANLLDQDELPDTPIPNKWIATPGRGGAGSR